MTGVPSSKDLYNKVWLGTRDAGVMTGYHEVIEPIAESSNVSRLQEAFPNARKGLSWL